MPGRGGRYALWVLVGFSSSLPSISLIDRSTRSSLRWRWRRLRRSPASSPRRMPVVAARVRMGASSGSVFAASVRSMRSSSISGAVVRFGAFLLLGSSKPRIGLALTLPCRRPHLYAPESAARALFIRLWRGRLGASRRRRCRCRRGEALCVDVADLGLEPHSVDLVVAEYGGAFQAADVTGEGDVPVDEVVDGEPLPCLGGFGRGPAFA